MQFISTPAQAAKVDQGKEDQAQAPAPVSTPQEAPATPPPGYKLNPLYVETKSKRIQMLIQPSLYKRIQKNAKKKRLSVNAMMHALLERALDAVDAEDAR